MTKEQLLNIRVRVTDQHALEKLEPGMVQAYFDQHGWEPLSKGWRVKDTQWIRDQTTKARADYGQRLRQILHELSLAEDRSELAIYVEMLEQP